jgi:hypothetical protein
MEQNGKTVQNGTWLRDVRAKERDKGVNHKDLACYASSLTPYVRDHLARAAQGIEELYGQLPSVIIPDGAQRTFWEEGREDFISRVCEVLSHLGAALAAVGCTDNELKRACGCEEHVKEAKRDILPLTSVSTTRNTDAGRDGSPEDGEAADSVVARTEDPEEENKAGERRVAASIRRPFGV